MKLKDDKNWKAVHFTDRTVLRSDWYLYDKYDWEQLTGMIEVIPMKNKGHYKAIKTVTEQRRVTNA